MGKFLAWIVLGAIVGWLVGRITNTQFKGGVLGNIAVGIVTMVLLGWLLTLLKFAFSVLWVLIVIAVIVVFGAWLLDTLSKRQ